MKKAYLITTTLLSLICPTFAEETPEIPWGTLSVDRDKVREGESAQLSWKVNYPPVLEDLVNEELEIQELTKVQAFMIGTAVNNHQYSTRTQVDLGAGWKTLYEGTGAEKLFIGYKKVLKRSWYGYYYTYVPVYKQQPNIDTKIPIWEREASTGTDINFRSKLINVSGYDSYIQKGDNRVLLMRKGDRPASKEGWGGDASLEDYIAPYIKNGVLAIGDFDIMVAAELTHSWSKRNDSGYDSNDSIALFRFIPVEK